MLFFGLLLTLLSMVALCFTLITVKFEQDRTLRAIQILSQRYLEYRDHMNNLFELSKFQIAPPPKPRLASPRRIRPPPAVVEQRKALGLPPTTPPLITLDSIDPPPQPAVEPPSYVQGYSKFLREQTEEVAKDIGLDPNELERFRDPKMSPADILTRLATEEQNIQKRPVEFLGVRAPRSIAVEYLGANFQFQYGIISTVLLVLLGPLVSGWLTTLYMTRQREMFEVTCSSSFGDVFPHIMNFVPVTFARFTKKPLTELEKNAHSTLMAFLRIVMSIAILTPMLGAYIATVVISWPFSDAVLIAIPFLIYIFVQLIAFLVQEDRGLRGVYFAEI